jgi:hypothetical protein
MGIHFMTRDLMIFANTPRTMKMSKKEAARKKYALEIDVTCLTKQENDIRDQIRELAIQALQIKQERLNLQQEIDALIPFTQ